MPRLRRLARIAGLVSLVVPLIAAAALALVRPRLLGAPVTVVAASPPPVAAEAPARLEAATTAAPVAAPIAARMVGWAPAPQPLAGGAVVPAVSGEAAIVVDEASGAILYEKESRLRLPPASLTKIMTALLALERGRPDDTVAVGVDSRRMRGSTVMGLVPGERLTLEDLLYGLMLPSGNDAALAIAEHVSGSTEAFVALMNQRAAELGLVDTHFANPHGLDSGPHYTSAYDLAVLARLAMQRQDFREIANTRYRVVTGELATYHLGTLNPLYGRLAGVDGVKTGYTRSARQTLVGSVTRDGHRVLVVVLRSPDRATDGMLLLNWAFQAHQWAAPSTVAGEAPAGPGLS